MGVPMTGNGNGRWAALRLALTRAPELLAIVVVVALFLWHLQDTAKAGISAMTEVRTALSEVTKSLSLINQSLVATLERLDSAMDLRSREHEIIENACKQCEHCK